MSAVLIVDKLRASLLQAAIQGKLTKQLPKDGDARDLLKEIEAEKSRLIEEKIIRKEKPLPPITDEEIPFEIPENWVWVKLGNILQLISGQDLTVRDYSDTEVGIPYITGASNFHNGFLEINRWTNAPKSIATKGDLLLTCKGTIGDMAFLLVEKVHIARQVMAISDKTQKLELNFIKIVLDNHIQYLKSIAKSMIPGINRGNVLSCLIPLPPLEEQRRIVEVIENALVKIDKLKIDEDKLDKIQKALPNKLRSALLQSAIQGKLTEQLPTDGDAHDLLKEIEAEKARMVEEKIIKKEKPLPPITEDEIPFEIPENWAWVRIGDVAIINPRNKLDDDLDTAFIPMAHISDGYRNEFIYDVRKWKDIKKGFTHFANNDLVVAKITPCFQNRKSVVLQNLPNGFGSGTTELHVIRTISNLINPLYLLSLSKSDGFINSGIANFTGTAGQQRIGRDFISQYLLPLPPLAEQQRIVDELYSILGKVNNLSGITN